MGCSMIQGYYLAYPTTDINKIREKIWTPVQTCIHWIETCKANRVDPYRYLVALFKALPSAKVADDYEQLLPLASTLGRLSFICCPLHQFACWSNGVVYWAALTQHVSSGATLLSAPEFNTVAQFRWRGACLTSGEAKRRAAPVF